MLKRVGVACKSIFGTDASPTQGGAVTVHPFTIPVETMVGMKSGSPASACVALLKINLVWFV